jgi:hypothetical protein
VNDCLIAPRLNRKYTNPRSGADLSHRTHLWSVYLVKNESKDSPKLLLCTAIRFSGITCKSYNPEENISLRNLAIPVTGRGGLWRFEILRIPHCLDNRLTDGGKVVSLKHRPRSIPQKHFSTSGTHFC